MGMMLVGRRWDDATVLRAAHAYEETGVYQAKPPMAMVGNSCTSSDEEPGGVAADSTGRGTGMLRLPAHNQAA
ncbi:MAG: hypothetical protein U0531_00550 [Dehalococcoidia bacterium]